MKDSLYQQYKRDTNFVAEWLIDTAERLGYSGAALAPSPRPKPAKSYKTPQKHLDPLNPTKRVESEHSEPARAVHKLEIEEYGNLAVFIDPKYHAGQLADFPRFSNTLDRCIARRKEHNLLYPSFYPTRATHLHFIKELEKVRAILRPPTRGVSSHKPPPARNRNANNNVNHPNIFSQLSVQEPTKSDSSETCLVSLPQSPSNVTYETGGDRDTEEAHVSFVSLISRYKSIRGVTLKTWLGYRKGTYSLATASGTANTALDLLKSLKDDMKPTFDKVGGFEQLLEQSAQYQLTSYGNERHVGCLETFLCPAVYERTRWLFPLWPTYMLLSRVLKALDQGLSRKELSRCFSFTGCQHGDYDPTSSKKTRVTVMMFLEDQAILKKALLEVFAYGKISPMPVEDRLTKDLKVMFKTRKITLSLLFGLQTFLDIHYALKGDPITRGFEDLNEFSAHVRDTISSTKAFRTDHNFPGPAALNAEGNDSPISETVRLLWNDDELLHNCQEPHKLLKIHPLLSGTWLSSIKAKFHEIGIHFPSTSNVILCACHLYNALHRERRLKKEWKDMELLLTLHGDGLFVGGRQASMLRY
ncbi:hypothetical protein BDW74DRAFT_175825 [Aspergillus multicolor]|uniref:uncharacterized protein n=1 Tax=Aspergillus multicolor TaxID=41759 RepID=UPI003CCCBFEE